VKAVRELDRLSKMPAAAAEYTVARTYIDWIIALAVEQSGTGKKSSISRKTKEILDADHSGLEARQGSHPRVPRGPQAQSPT
jgi:ATP-dependent Lon protease